MYEEEIVKFKPDEEGLYVYNFLDEYLNYVDKCKKEMKHLSRINKEYSESGFQVVSINMDSPRTMKKVKQFTKSQKYSFKILSDPRMELFRKLGGNVMPLVVIVNIAGSNPFVEVKNQCCRAAIFQKLRADGCVGKIWRG